jgi:hypothetical protein
MSSNTLATPQATAGFDVDARFRSLMNELGLSPEDTGGIITFAGAHKRHFRCAQNVLKACSGQAHRSYLAAEILAVAEGFEPSDGGYPSHAFEACSLGRSDTPPPDSLPNDGLTTPIAGGRRSSPAGRRTRRPAPHPAPPVGG